jgi:hypothetical protein
MLLLSNWGIQVTNSAFKKIAALLTVFTLIGGVVYAGCMTCDGLSAVQELTTADCCAHGEISNQFKPQSSDCCEKKGCNDIPTDTTALTRRSEEIKTPVLVAVITTPSTLAPRNDYHFITATTGLAPAPPTRTYLQHCSFLC